MLKRICTILSEPKVLCALALLWIILTWCLRAHALPPLLRRADIRPMQVKAAAGPVLAKVSPKSLTIGGQRFVSGQIVSVDLGGHLAFAVSMDAQMMRLLQSATVADNGELAITGAPRVALLHHLYGRISNNQNIAEAEALEKHQGALVFVEHAWSSSPARLDPHPLAEAPQPSSIDALTASTP